MLINFTLVTGGDVFINPDHVSQLSPGGGPGLPAVAATLITLLAGESVRVVGDMYHVAHRINNHMGTYRMGE